MARAHFRETFVDQFGNVISGMTVHLYEPGTFTPIVAAMYTTETGSTVVANPATTDANGVLDFYIDVPQDAKIVAVKSGYTTQTVDNFAVGTGEEVLHYTLNRSLTNVSAVNVTETQVYSFAVPTTGSGVRLGCTLSARFMLGITNNTGSDQTWRIRAKSDGVTVHDTGDLIIPSTVSVRAAWLEIRSKEYALAGPRNTSELRLTIAGASSFYDGVMASPLTAVLGTYIQWYSQTSIKRGQTFSLTLQVGNVSVTCGLFEALLATE